MRRFAALFLMLSISTAFAADKMKPGKCTFANVERVKSHAAQHIKYPAKGKDVKVACKKEWPDEFSKEEWACIDASIADDKEYKSCAELLKAIGME